MMTDVLLDAQSAREGMREYQAASPLVGEIVRSSRKQDLSSLELYSVRQRSATITRGSLALGNAKNNAVNGAHYDNWVPNGQVGYILNPNVPP